MRALTPIAFAAVGFAALACAAPASAETCSQRNQNRQVVGTVLGGVGGALLGNAVHRGSTGAIVGGLGGAFIGNRISRVDCSGYRTSYRGSRGYRSAARAEAPRPVRYVYYDQYGAPVSAGPAPAYAQTPAVQTVSQPAYVQAAYSDPACRTETRAYYDERGRLIYRPTQICAR